MICFNDRTYCAYWKLCKDGHTCKRAFTDEVKRASLKQELPICMFSDFPKCFIAFFDTGTKKAKVKK